MPDSASGKYEGFANLCTGLQAIFLIVGLVGGGVWSVYLYNTLHESERANAEMVRTEMELRRQLDEFRRAFGQITLTATPVAAAHRGGCYMQVVAKVTNAGNRKIKLTLNESMPLHVASTRIDRGHTVDFAPVASTQVYAFSPRGTVVAALPASELLPGESSDYPFLVKLPRRGVYFIQFSVPVRVLPIAGEHPDSVKKEGWFWTARAYVTACAGSQSSDPRNVQLAAKDESLPVIE